MSPTVPTRIRKRPVEVVAMFHDGTRESARAIEAWLESHGWECVSLYNPPSIGWAVEFATTDGNKATVAVGVWVIRGVQGEFYPCQDGVLRATYDILTRPSGPPPNAQAPQAQP